jgi:tetratricopeptide (TPR) repeat protein
LAEAYYNRGNTYATLGKYEHALEEYSQAITIEPSLVQAYNKRGLAYHELGLYEEAIADYTQAIRVVENSS